MQVLNRTAGLRCYCCGDAINVGHYKNEIHKGRWCHSGCYNKRMAKILFKRESKWQKIKKSYRLLLQIWRR